MRDATPPVRVSLNVRCNVSGRFVRAKTQGDPNDCYEAESPEIEPLSATWEEIENLETGAARNPDEGERAEFDLKSLSAAELAQLNDSLFGALADGDRYARENDEPYDD
jgi:hypothetical protein